jgi:hypothetical protein
MKAQSLKRLERSSPLGGDLVQTPKFWKRQCRTLVPSETRLRSPQKSGVEANSRRIPGNLGFTGKQNLPDQFQFRVPAFEFVGIVYAGELQHAGDGLGAANDLARPDGKAGIAVEGHLSAGEMANEPLQQGHGSRLW